MVLQDKESYLNNNPDTKLIIYLKDPILNNLIPYAHLVFSEEPRALPLDNIELNTENTIYISQNSLSYQNITEPINIERIDKLTHLSAYCITAATILGGFILGESVEKSLKLARANVENSSLNSTLGLAELKTLANEEDSLDLIAASLMYKGKGILAADESGGSIKKKFANLNIPDTFENRHNYRDIFFTTPNIENYINGVILFDETARDYADDGQTYVDFLTSHRIIPGIKVDEGLANFPDSEETYTKGLDNLPKRLREYREMGLRFAKWRAAFNLTLSDSGEILTPTTHAVEENCRILAEYAKACQSAGLVPIVEPELVYDGYYPIEKSTEITSKILDSLFKELVNLKVNLRATISVTPNMANNSKTNLPPKKSAKLPLRSSKTMSHPNSPVSSSFLVAKTSSKLPTISKKSSKMVLSPGQSLFPLLAPSKIQPSMLGKVTTTTKTKPVKPFLLASSLTPMY